MRRILSLLVVALIPFLCCLSTTAQAQKAKKGKVDPDGEIKNTQKLVKSGVIIAKVMNVYEDKKRIRIQISIPVTKLDAGAPGQIANAQQQVLQATLAYRNATDYAGRNQAAQQLAQAQVALAKAQAGLYKTEMVNKEIEVQAIDDVVVRSAKPKADFDEKGRIKKYTKAELKAMKGTSKLPGYQAEFSDLQTEQIIKITTVKKKGTPIVKAPTKKAKGKKGKDEDGLVDGLVDELPQVSIIEILREPVMMK